MNTIKQVPLADLHPASWLKRLASDTGVHAFARSLKADPDMVRVRPVLATADCIVYAGWQRVLAAKSPGCKEIACHITDVPEPLARERAIPDNVHVADWDEDGFEDVLRDLDEEDSDLTAPGVEDRELQQLLDGLDHDTDTGDPDKIPELPVEPLTRPGDCWLLGKHVVVCGDSTDVKVLESLQAGAHAGMAWIDPPYGVKYDSRTKRKLTIQNDAADGLETLLTKAFQAMDAVLMAGVPNYVCHPAGPLAVTFAQCFARQGWSYPTFVAT